MLWALTPLVVQAAEGGASRPLAHAGEVPQQRLYARIDDLGGPVRGRYRRRRSAEFLAWELEGDTILRYQRFEGDAVVEDHRFDAAGWPLTTVHATAEGPQRVVVHTQPPSELDVTGWTPWDIPGGRILAPAQPADREGGGVRLDVAGGHLDVWRDGRKADVFSDAFRDGLLAGCGCIAVDRATAWVDSRPGVRYRLIVPGTEPADAVDVWAVPLRQGSWLAAFRAPASDESLVALDAGRAMIALVRLEEP